MNAKEQYKLACSLVRAKRGAESYHAMTSYDRYCEITSYSDLRDDNYDEIADAVDYQDWRESVVADYQKSFVDENIGKVDVELFKVAAKHVNTRQYPRKTEFGCYIRTNAHWISCARNSYNEKRRSEIAFYIQLAKDWGGWQHVRFHNRYKTSYDMVKVTPERKAELRAEIIEFYQSWRSGQVQ
jgi:hypothetical protein